MDKSQAILSDIVVFNKYAKYVPETKRRETWDELCETLVNDVCGDRSRCAKPNTDPLMSKEDQAQLVEYMKDMKFIPGGRYLYYAGRPVSYFNNCFSGETTILTSNGMETFKSLVGQEIQVYSPISKQFEYAVMHEHGYQKLNKITLS